MNAGDPCTRRAFVSAVCSVPLFANQNLPADRGRYADPSTEFSVVRLTDPSYDSYLPVSRNRAISRHGSFLIYASDRGGALQVLRMDLKSGESTVLTDTADLKSWSVTLLPGERSVCFLSGSRLISLALTNKKTRIIYEIPGEFEGAGLTISEDGNHAFVTERNGANARLRVAPLRGAASTIAEGPGIFSDPSPRPRRAGVLYRRDDGSVWLVNYDGQQNRRLKTAPGRVLRAIWSPDGRTVLYLNDPEERQGRAVLREHTPDSNTDTQLAVTSQYADFDRNADGTVLLGVSGSKAQPHILLMLRSVKRELTLCEHKASDPKAVSAQFAPDGRRIYFQSDRSGKPAIYTMGVERLVESTESD